MSLMLVKTQLGGQVPSQRPRGAPLPVLVTGTFVVTAAGPSCQVVKRVLAVEPHACQG